MPWRRRSNLHAISNNKGGHFDYRLLAVTLALVIIGLFIVYDASAVQAFRDFNDKYFYIRQQLIWVALGSMSLFFFSLFPYRLFEKLAPLLLGGAVILLMAVFIPGLGFEAGGAHRWLRLGPFTLQPTEIIKLTSIIFFAALLSGSSNKNSGSFQKQDKLMPFILITGFITMIIGIFQKDLGSAIVFCLSVGVLLVLSGVPGKFLAYFAGSGVVAFLLFVLTSPYRKQRVLAFMDPFADPMGFSYHISQVLIALGSGNLIGLGLGQSRQKFEFIPEVTTDSIFAIIGEEFGFVGALVVIGLLCYLVWRGLQIAENCRDPFGRMLAFGLTFWLGIQSAINLGAMVSLIPLTGVPLPFISYGGSALLANLVAIGILLNIARSNKN